MPDICKFIDMDKLKITLNLKNEVKMYKSGYYVYNLIDRINKFVNTLRGILILCSKMYSYKHIITIIS
jgi:hypothetical protein